MRNKIDVEVSLKNNADYVNDFLATVGDTIIKFVIASYLYKGNNKITKDEITKKKELLEKNETLHNITIK